MSGRHSGLHYTSIFIGVEMASAKSARREGGGGVVVPNIPNTKISCWFSRTRLVSSKRKQWVLLLRFGGKFATDYTQVPIIKS